MARQESADSAWCSFGHASDPACKAISSNPTRASVGGNVESIQGGGEGPAAQVPGSPGSGQGRPVCPRHDGHLPTTLPCLLPLLWGLGGEAGHPTLLPGRPGPLSSSRPLPVPGRALLSQGRGWQRLGPGPPPPPRPGHLTVPPWPAPALATGDSAAMTAGTPTRASPQDMES